MKSREQRLAELLKKFGLDDVGEETVGNSSTDESKVINTPPATAETPVVPPSRARVKDNNINYSDYSDYSEKDNINYSDYSEKARAREKKSNNEEYFKRLRIAKFGGDFDLVAEAVNEALKNFKPDNLEITRRVWLKICNRVGYQNFLDAVHQQQSLIQEYENRGKKCWNKALLFHRLLNTRFPLPKSKGGAK